LGTLDWLPGRFKVKVARFKRDGEFLHPNGKFRPAPAIHWAHQGAPRFISQNHFHSPNFTVLLISEANVV
jgi:hypothetical protein